jgi:predicted unusual protein kinase regulating ubiquinone biosynthesis (AarF/ABC1/UbiB family)
MAKIYKENEVTDEIHYKAATLLYECFAKNAGTYIKLGQMVG